MGNAGTSRSPTDPGNRLPAVKNYFWKKKKETLSRKKIFNTVLKPCVLF